MKFFRVSLCFFLVMALIGCSSEKEKAKKVSSDTGRDEIEVTIPAVLLQHQDVDAVIENAKSKGIKEVIKNDDGSLTYKMSKSVYNKMVKELETTIKNMVSEAKKNLQSVKGITHNKNLSEFTFSVERKTYENSMDALVIYTLGVVALNYQLFKNENGGAEKAVSVSLKDENTGEVFTVMDFPDVLNELNKHKNKQ